MSANEAFAAGFVRVRDDRGQDGPRTRRFTVWAQGSSAPPASGAVPDGEDIVARVYGSEDFKEGCAASPRSAHPGGAEK
jgi:hypothetical protein